MKAFVLLITGILTIAQCMSYRADQVVSIPEDNRHVIYEIDGVEYVDTENRNTTMKLVLEESFFTNI